MAISMYKVSIPLFIRGLTSLSNVLKKGDAFAQAAHTRSKSIEPDNLLQQRLIFDMLPLIKQIQTSGDKTIVLVEHNMNVVMSISDRITVMHQGQMLAEGTPAEIAANETVQRAYLGGLYEL